MDDPLARAELVDQAATQERSEAMDLFHTASNLSETAENLRQMGLGAAAAPLDMTADWAAKAGATDMQQYEHLAKAADHWREVAGELDDEAKHRGAALVAGASAEAALDQAGHATGIFDQIGHMVTAASYESSKQQLLDEAGTDQVFANVDAKAAIVEEQRARDLEP